MDADDVNLGNQPTRHPARVHGHDQMLARSCRDAHLSFSQALGQPVRGVLQIHPAALPCSCRS